MKKNWIYATMLLAVLGMGTAGCSDDDEKYASTVIRDVQLSKDGEPYSVGMSGYENNSNNILFVYTPAGDYLASYMPDFRFALENGSYKIIAISNYGSLIGSTGANLNTLEVAQDSMADKTVMSKIVVSDPVPYTVPSGGPLKLDMKTRVGTIRLRALDDEKDMRVSTVRAIITTPRSAWHFGDGSYTEVPMETSRDKDTPTGGRNYTDDFMFFPTESEDKGVSIRFEFLDAAKNIVKTKQIEGTYGVYPDSTHILQVYLNNPDDNKAYPFVPEPDGQE